MICTAQEWSSGLSKLPIPYLWDPVLEKCNIVRVSPAKLGPLNREPRRVLVSGRSVRGASCGKIDDAPEYYTFSYTTSAHVRNGVCEGLGKLYIGE